MMEHDVEAPKSEPKVGDGFCGEVFEGGGGARRAAACGGLPFACYDGSVVGEGAVPRDAGLPLPELTGGDGDAVDH